MTKRQCVTCGIKRDDSKFAGPRARVCLGCRKKTAQAAARARHVATYDITVQEYEQMAANGCNICGGSRPYRLQIDHDHAIAAQFGMRASIRGAICKRDNKLLASIRDDPDLLRAAIAYLLNPPAKKILYP